MKNRYTEGLRALGIGALIVVVLVAASRSVRAGNDAADEALATIHPEG